MDIFGEYGRIGQRRYGGVFFEEFLTELQGQKGIEVYKEMSENDDIIGAMLFAIEMLMRQVTWDIEPAANTKADKNAAEFIKSCMNDMEQSWQDTISEIMSFLIYGWSYHEICYKRRIQNQSKYTDGLIGWKKLALRSQDTLYRWEYGENDDLLAMSQIAPPDYIIRTIPIEKALHFVTKSRKQNPEGRSILRNCYTDYYYKKRFRQIEGIGVERDLAGLPLLQPTKSRKQNPEGRSILRNCYTDYYYKKRFRQIEGIGVERDLAGLPLLQPPEGADIWNDDPENMKALAYAEKLVKNIRRDEKEGIVLPYGWTFSLVNGGSKRQFEIGNIIERIDNRMAMTCMADFVLLGHQQTGSFALSSDKTRLFAVAIGTYLDIICQTINTQAIPKLIKVNQSHFKNISDMPKLIHGDIEKQDLTQFADYIVKMANVGLLTLDQNLERKIREMGGLPEALEGVAYPPKEEENGG
ncbi:hypothetical protein [Clostridium sp. MD294]|uniref:phage portal protein family protein n=1 Tax=Clostridium sp. MD294 TaxID=97138 RepID=UPI001FABA8FF|nr:hypothetical protein [Clostridium sp. MD294]